VPYVTFNTNGSIRVVDHNEGWKLFEQLNNLHHLTVNKKGSVLVVDCNEGWKLIKTVE